MPGLKAGPHMTSNTLTQLAPLPIFILDRIRAGSSKQASVVVSFEGDIPEGSRNEALFKYGAELRAKGHTTRQLNAKLHKLNREKCNPPLPKIEVDMIVDSLDRYARGASANEDFSAAAQSSAQLKRLGGLKLVSLADVQWVKPRFLFEPYFPVGALSIIQGNPGDGKTAFLCKLAACLSVGTDLLGRPCDVGNSLLISVEDSPEALRGRFDASGGDPTRVKLVSSEQLPLVNFLTPELEQAIVDNDIRLLAFDPLQAFLGARVDMNKSNETRPVLARLAAIAAKTGCCIVLVSHMSKGSRDGPAIHRALGSVDIVGAARSVLQIGRNAKDPEERVAVHIKANGSPQGESVAFRIGAKGGVAISGPSSLAVEDLLSVSRRARLAAQSFPAEAFIDACRALLDQHPQGIKVTYDELGFKWPEGIQPKQFVEALRGRLEAEGIRVATGLRTKLGSALLITIIFRRSVAVVG